MRLPWLLLAALVVPCWPLLADPAPVAPVFILKLDDVQVRSRRAAVPPRWKRVVEYLDQQQVKSACGIICNSLALDNQAYLDWLRQVHAKGLVEFWFHGWDHAVHEEDGTKYNEFNHRPYDDQRQRFERSERLAVDQLGFPLATFGPGGGVGNGSFDANTVKAMADVPEMKVWLYPQPFDDAGRQLHAQGKVTVLDRVWAVNLESKVGVPDCAKLAAGLAKNPGRAYFVLQGHPNMWDDTRWAEFVKIIEYLKGRQAVFMTPSEYAAQARGR